MGKADESEPVWKEPSVARGKIGGHDDGAMQCLWKDFQTFGEYRVKFVNKYIKL